MIANIILVDNEKIKELNSQYRKIDNETDVLSFENDQGLAEIGDIFISIDKAKEQAKDYEHSFERELAFLSVHGFLHCLGYDHLNKNDEEVMFDLQKQILDNSKYRRNS
jgi:probable rRNA maturation factor